MFSIYKSSRLDLLLDQVCKIISKQPLSDPFQAEIFLVNNIETSHWIKLYIAEKLKISANINFFTPEDLIWILFKNITSNYTNQIILNKSIIKWTIMQFLEEKKIHHLIDIKDNIDKKFTFASQMSKIFLEYLIYRPYWMNKWRKKIKHHTINHDEIWQSKLWYKIVKYHKKNKKVLDYAQLLNNFITYEKNKKIKISFLPHRFFVFEILDIPLSILSILYTLSNTYQINLLLTTPYMNINHIKTHKYKNINYNPFDLLISKTYLKKKQHNLYNQFTNVRLMNPILLSLGQYGYEYISFLSLIKNKYINCSVREKKNTLLNIIQNDITNIINKKNITANNIDINRRILHTNDQSISIHICNNMKHEIKILHNNLLNIFNNSSLHPKNIIVKIFQLHLYIPFIQAIFSKKSHKNYIPFIIFNELSNTNNEILLSFKKLLNLGNIRFYKKEIFSLITSSALIKKFNINEKEIPILFDLINKSGIQWGLDSKHLQQLDLPDNNQYTWELGIQRIMLGYAIKNEKTTFNNISPCPIYGSEQIKLVTKIIKFISTLYTWKKKLATSKSLKSWLPICNALINDFFDINIDNYKFLEEIKEKWNAIINSGIKNQYKKKFLCQY